MPLCVNFHEGSLMFTSVPDPLCYSQDLLAQFNQLSKALNGAQLSGAFAGASASLTGCEIGQLYLLDATRPALVLKAEYWQGLLQPRPDACQATNYDREQLFQYALSQNKVV